MSKNPLPTQGANDEFLRKEAKRVLKAYKQKDPDAARVVHSCFPDGDVGLQQVQLALARSYGFDSWRQLLAALPRLARFIDAHTLQISRELESPLSVVWSAVSTSRGISQWFTKTEMRSEAGARFVFEGAYAGHIARFEPMRQIVFAADDGGTTEFELTDCNFKTTLLLRDVLRPDFACPIHVLEREGPISAHQPGGPGTHWAGIVAGWHSAMDALECYVSKCNPYDLEHQELVKLYDTMITHYYEEGV